MFHFKNVLNCRILKYLLPYNQKVTQHFRDAVPAITSNMCKLRLSLKAKDTVTSYQRDLWFVIIGKSNHAEITWWNQETKQIFLINDSIFPPMALKLTFKIFISFARRFCVLEIFFFAMTLTATTKSSFCQQEEILTSDFKLKLK